MRLGLQDSPLMTEIKRRGIPIDPSTEPLPVNPADKD